MAPLTQTLSINGAIKVISFDKDIAPLSKALSLSTSTTAFTSAQTALIGIDPTNIPLPFSPTTFLYLKNLHSTQTITLDWTPNGGSSNQVLTLQPKSFISFGGGAQGLSGITSLSVKTNPNSFIFNPLVSDTFRRADESPLNPTNWHSHDSLPANDQLQIVNNIATTTLQVQADGIASYINDSLPTDQYAEVQVTRLAINGLFWLYLRGGIELSPSYALAISNLFISPVDPKVFGYLVQEINSTASATYRWTPDTGIGTQLNLGDIITFAVVGGVGGSLYVFRNYAQFAKFNLNDSVTNVPQLGVSTNVPLPIITSGRVGLQIDSLSSPPTILDAGLNNFVGGSITPREIFTPIEYVIGG